MSILIRGMKMPKNGHVVIRIYSDGMVENETTEREIGTAVSLPEWHGRLIDADAPIRVACYDGTIHKTTASRLLCEHSLLDLPKTIVPAEGGTEDG